MFPFCSGNLQVCSEGSMPSESRMLFKILCRDGLLTGICFLWHLQFLVSTTAKRKHSATETNANRHLLETLKIQFSTTPFNTNTTQNTVRCSFLSRNFRWVFKMPCNVLYASETRPHCCQVTRSPISLWHIMGLGHLKLTQMFSRKAASQGQATVGLGQ